MRGCSIIRTLIFTRARDIFVESTRAMLRQRSDTKRGGQIALAMDRRDPVRGLPLDLRPFNKDVEPDDTERIEKQ